MNARLGVLVDRGEEAGDGRGVLAENEPLGIEHEDLTTSFALLVVRKIDHTMHRPQQCFSRWTVGDLLGANEY